MDFCDERLKTHEAFQELKLSEFRNKQAQQTFHLKALLEEDRKKYLRRQNAAHLRGRAPFRRCSCSEEYVCRHHKLQLSDDQRLRPRVVENDKSRDAEQLMIFEPKSHDNELSNKMGSIHRNRALISQKFLSLDHDRQTRFDQSQELICIAEGIKLQTPFKRPSTVECGAVTYMGLEYGSMTQPCSSNTSATASTSVSEKEFVINRAYEHDNCESPPELLSSPVGITPSPPINQISYSPFSAPHRRVSHTSSRKKSLEIVVFPRIECAKCDLSSRFPDESRDLVSNAILSQNQEVDINDGVAIFPDLHCRKELPCREQVKLDQSNLRIETSQEYGDAFEDSENNPALDRDRGIWNPNWVPLRPECGSQVPSPTAASDKSPSNSNEVKSFRSPGRSGKWLLFKADDVSRNDAESRRVQFGDTDTWEDMNSRLDVQINGDENNIVVEDVSLQDQTDVDCLSRMLSWRNIIDSSVVVNDDADAALSRDQRMGGIVGYPFEASFALPVSLGGSQHEDEEDDEAFRSYEKALQRDYSLSRKQLEAKLMRYTVV